MSDEQQWFIYVLKDPQTDEVRYVGVTTNAAQRYRDHLYKARREQTHKGYWIATLLDAEIKPVMMIIERGQGDGWAEAERRHIAAYRAAGARLTNASDGGESAPGYTHSEEARAKLSEAARQRIASPEMRAKLSAASRRRMADPEVRAKFRTAAQQQMADPAARAKISAITRQRMADPEARAKLSAVNRQRLANPEVRAKMGRPVRCVETGVVYLSGEAAGAVAGVSGGAIRSAVRTGCRAGGYHWERINND